jgi:lycopene beta-cyclase
VERFDVAIIGLGVGGSLLLRELVERKPELKILVIEPSEKNQNDRIISFWSDEAFPFPDMPYHSWSSVGVQTPLNYRTTSITPYKYYSFEGIELYNLTKKLIQEHQNVTLVHEPVISMMESAGGVIVSTASHAFSAQIVFDGHRDIAAIKKEAESAGSLFLYQEFSGFKIKTTTPAFTAAEPTLFDFRTPQNNGFSFAYILPFNEYEAMIDYVVYTETLHGDTSEQLTHYISDILGITEYTITFKEGGVIPLTTHRFPRSAGKNLYRIGTNGGMIKPSTGYGFTRMLAESKDIARQITANNKTITFYNTPEFFRLSDTLLLRIMQKNHERCPEIFTSLFKHENSSRILKFLDEKASVTEVCQTGLDLPKMPFITALFQ